MATLKEAVESGRRWRLCFKAGPPGPWFGPGFEFRTPACVLTPRQALSSDFEIEPEPEKPSEWYLLVQDSTGRLHDHYSNHRCDLSEPHTKVRVHDADACDRLRDGCRQNPI